MIRRRRSPANEAVAYNYYAPESREAETKACDRLIARLPERHGCRTIVVIIMVVISPSP
jgi:hypothetical protein